jgi:hypothetical protein
VANAELWMRPVGRSRCSTKCAVRARGLLAVNDTGGGWQLSCEALPEMQGNNIPCTRSNHLGRTQWIDSVILVQVPLARR